jgi:hypothetical protein
MIHPFPPSELPEWLQHTIAADNNAREFGTSSTERLTHNVRTNENKKEKRMDAISALGAMDATA